MSASVWVICAGFPIIRDQRGQRVDQANPPVSRRRSSTPTANIGCIKCRGIFLPLMLGSEKRRAMHRP